MQGNQQEAPALKYTVLTALDILYHSMDALMMGHETWTILGTS
jgi:hypothetical protein